MISIYKIENKNNKKIYIGQSIHCGKRFDEHYKGEQLIDKIIQSEGIENFSFEILKEVEKENLNFWEDYFIMKYNSIYPNGYNKKWNCNKKIRGEIKKELEEEQSINRKEKKSKEEKFYDLCDKYSIKTAHLYGYFIGLWYTYREKIKEIEFPLEDFSSYIEESKENVEIIIKTLIKRA